MYYTIDFHKPITGLACVTKIDPPHSKKGQFFNSCLRFTIQDRIANVFKGNTIAANLCISATTCCTCPFMGVKSTLQSLAQAAGNFILNVKSSILRLKKPSYLYMSISTGLHLDVEF